MGLEEREQTATKVALARKASIDGPDDDSTTSSEGSFNPITMNGNGHVQMPAKRGLGLTLSTSDLAMQNHNRAPSKNSGHSHSISATSLQSVSPITPLQDGFDAFPSLQPSFSRHSQLPPYTATTLSSSLPPRVQSRLKTIKSALLIYFTLLGLSPILKSLTRSTSSDSIWALATWLLIINIFFFDYGGLYVSPKPHPSPITNTYPAKAPHNDTTTESALAPHGSAGSAPPFPSSLSTNAALMASTVLASRLPSITHVFSLTVFSIEVFGLFPVFRRHLRHMSWNGHFILTFLLVMASSAGMSIILSTSWTHTYGACGFCWGWIWHVLRRSILGMLIGGLGTSLVMGGCSWWLISLQRYKNVVIGPWDPARPVLAGGPLVRGRGGSG
jgi:phosphatidylinositol N-acetylglucosaminyltransferase subunit C